MTTPRHVLRIASVFEPPDAALYGDGVRFDPIGGMQNHTAQLTRALDRRGVVQTVVTTRPPGAPESEPFGRRSTVIRHGARVPWLRQLYAPAAARTAHRLAPTVDLVHAHLGEDVAVLPIAVRAARRAGAPLVVTVHTSLNHTFTADGRRPAVADAQGGRRADRALGL